MEKRTRNLIRNTSILTITNFSSKLLVFLLVPLYTHVLTTEEYGTYDLVMSTIQLLIPMFTLNVADAVLRFSMNKDVEINKIKSIGFRYIAMSVVYMCVLILLNKLLRLWTAIKGLEITVLLYFAFFVMNQVLIQTAKGQEQIKQLGIAGLLSTGVSIIGNIVFLLIIPLRLKGFFLAYTLGLVASVLYLTYETKFFSGLSFRIDQNLKKKMLVYSVPLIMGTLGWLVNNVSDRYVVTWLCGISENGIYSIAYKIPNIIATVQNIFIQAWTISAIKEFNQNNRNTFYANMFKYMNALMVCCCSGLIFTTKLVSMLLFAKEFYGAWQYVPFLLVSVVFGASSGFIGPILSAKMDSKSLATSTVIGAFINLVLNITLIPIIGPQGAAVATAISNLFIYIYRRKAIGKMLYSSSYTKIMLSWILVIIQAIFMVLEFKFVYQLPLIILLLAIYRQENLRILNKFLCGFDRKNGGHLSCGLKK